MCTTWTSRAASGVSSGSPRSPTSPSASPGVSARMATRSSVAIGSVKSMIGHTKCAAGLAGLINASLALHHKVMPPTIGVETLNPKADLADGPFHVSSRLRPWLHADDRSPRRAGVSAFGFGGTNFHAVLEAHEPKRARGGFPAIGLCCRATA